VNIADNEKRKPDPVELKKKWMLLDQFGQRMFCNVTFKMVTDPDFLQHRGYDSFDCMDFVHLQRY